MATQTPILALNKPAVGADVDVWGSLLNSNADVLDFAAVLNKGTTQTFTSAISAPQFAGPSDTDTFINFPGANRIGITTAGFARFEIDANGNMGLGVVPSPWNAAHRALQVGAQSAFFEAAGQTFLTYNDYISDVDRYIASGFASRLFLTSGGAFVFNTAPSGTAGNPISFNQAMTLTNLGSLLINATNSAGAGYYFEVTNASDASLVLSDANQINYFGGGSVIRSLNAAKNAVTPLAIQGTEVKIGPNANTFHIDTAGNLGLGVVPSAWASFKALQVGPVGSLSAQDFGGGNIQTQIANNAYFDGLNYRYLVSTVASRYNQIGGDHQWFTASAGTAGNPISFTQAMTLTNAGVLLLNTTSTANLSSAARFEQLNDSSIDLRDTRTGGVGVFENNIRFTNFLGQTQASITYTHNDALGPAPQSLIFRVGGNAERVRITNAGNLLVGTTIDGADRLSVQGNVFLRSGSSLRLSNPDNSNSALITNTAGPGGGQENVTISTATVDSFRVDGNNNGGNTRLMIYDVDNGTLERVSVGAADSGGAGFKVLRIPN